MRDDGTFITMHITHGQASEFREVVKSLAYPGTVESQSDSEAQDAMRDLLGEVTSSMEYASDYDKDLVAIELPCDEVWCRTLGLALLEYGYGEA